MTQIDREASLTRLEVVVLARLSGKTQPSEKELSDAVRSLALPAEAPARAREIVAGVLAGLHGRGLVGDLPVRSNKQPVRTKQKQPPQKPRKKRPPPPPPPPKPGRTLTEAGQRALCAAFELESSPRWEEVRDKHLPGLALGFQPGSNEAREVLDPEQRPDRKSGAGRRGNGKRAGGKREKKDGAGARVAVAVIRQEFDIPEAASVTALGDALIAQALGLPPGRVTLDRIRGHLIARLVEAQAKGKAEQVAARVAKRALRAGAADKRSLVHALARRWASAPADRERVQSASANAREPQSFPADAATPPAEGPSSVPPALRPLLAPTELLAMVRDAIPAIGADGRFGPEKVFVSAIWERLQGDGRMLDFSLDRFKRWLVAAQRERLLDLARADLVGAMDPHLVAESEIEDLGSTFHFVLDHGVTVLDSDRRFHAR
jgi:hypothetical protein